MSISRNFLVIGACYLVVGIVFGMYMGGSGDHTLAPVHAHINLLGFTLMSVFGVLYRIIPAMSDSGLGKVHFWLYQIGVLALLVALYLMMSGTIAAETIGPAMPVFEGMILIGILSFVLNLFRSA